MSIKTVTQGVPRFSELISAVKSPKMVNCIIYLQREYNERHEVVSAVGQSLTEVKIKKIISSSSYCCFDHIEDWHYLFWKMMKGSPLPVDHLGWRVRLEFNRDLLFEYGINMKMIAERIQDEYVDVVVCYTPEFKGIVDVFIDNRILNTPTVQPANRFIIEKEWALLYNYFDEKVIPSLYDILLCGTPGVREIFYEKRGSEWIITTEGSNLYGLFSNPLVDATKTISNNMWEILDTLGIEATRQFLFEEFIDVVSSDGTFINPAHIQLLVDAMVFSGTIISISRYGARKMEGGAISNASFEQSLETLTRAGLKGETELINGVSASILLGKMPRVGTGVVELLVDMDKLTVQDTVMETNTETLVSGVSETHWDAWGSDDDEDDDEDDDDEDDKDEKDEVQFIQEFKYTL